MCIGVLVSVCIGVLVTVCGVCVCVGVRVQLYRYGGMYFYVD